MGRAPGARRAPAPDEPIRPDGGFGGELEGQALPFLHRYMLNYGQEATFQLQIRSQSSTDLALKISGGTRSALINHRFTAGTGADAKTTTIGIDDFPIFLAVHDRGGSEIQGNTFVTVNLLINGETVASLMSGYVYAGKPLTWPKTNTKDLLPNRGEIGMVVSSDPAAGAQVSLTVDDNEIWRVMWASIILVTDSNAANRLVHLVFTPDTAGQIDIFGDKLHTASLTRTHQFFPVGYMFQRADGDIIQAPLANDFWIEPSTVISTEITAGQAGDDFGPLAIMREKFYVGN